MGADQGGCDLISRTASRIAFICSRSRPIPQCDATNGAPTGFEAIPNLGRFRPHLPNFKEIWPSTMVSKAIVSRDAGEPRRTHRAARSARDSQ